MALLASPAFAADWQFLVQSSTGSLVEIDASSIARVDGTTKKAWFRETEPTPKKFPLSSDSYKETKSLVHFRCAERTSATAQKIHYTEAGEVVRSSVVAKADMFFADVVPDSIGEEMLNTACGQGGKLVPSATAPGA
jgi:hypothetical protein